MSQARLTWTFSQPLYPGYASVRLTYSVNQALAGGYPAARLGYSVNQPLVGGYSTVRLSQMISQALIPVPKDPMMSTEIFPGFGNSVADHTIPEAKDPASAATPGLSFSVHKKPHFSTKVHEATSGKEVRTAYMNQPVWDFELNYEFLEDRTGANSSLRKIMGFFMARFGSYDTWLLKDPDDYLVTEGQMGLSDGLTTLFYFRRWMGTFAEIVGQVDTNNAITLYNTVVETHTVPGAGPYTITVNHPLTIVDHGVTLAGVAMVKVASAPATGQYSVNLSTGVYTFNAAQGSAAVVITYRYTIAGGDYVLTMPNYVVFTSAPPVGTIAADFQFFFNCRFKADDMDFEKFYDKLWALQSCKFTSVLQ